MRQNGLPAQMWKTKFVGSDGPLQRALPAGEFFHPLSLLALALLVLNDWYLKPSSWAPALLTGKLSDFAGLLFFPLLLTSLLNCLRLGASRLGADVDFTLRRGKLLFAISLTALGFSAIKLSSFANRAAVDMSEVFGLPAHFVRDPTDLVALASLYLSWRIGLSEIARVPLGRMELIRVRHERRGVVAGDSLHDIILAGANRHNTNSLIQSLDRYLEEPTPKHADEVDAGLAKLRDPSLRGAFFGRMVDTGKETP